MSRNTNMVINFKAFVFEYKCPTFITIIFTFTPYQVNIETVNNSVN